jgi:hypothetical protein
MNINRKSTQKEKERNRDRPKTNAEKPKKEHGKAEKNKIEFCRIHKKQEQRDRKRETTQIR